MISDNDKNRAIAKLKLGIEPETIAEELEVPTMLVKEWAKNLEPKDLVAIEANIHAVETVLNGEVLEEDTLSKLRTKIEDVALDLVEEIKHSFGDPMYAKSVQLCADSLVKLYVGIGGASTTSPQVGQMNNAGISVFSDIMSD